MGWPPLSGAGPISRYDETGPAYKICGEACRVTHNPKSPVEIRDVVAGLWVWRAEHPRWKPNQGLEPVVASTCVESGGETLVLDPLAPPAGASEVWERLAALSISKNFYPFEAPFLT